MIANGTVVEAREPVSVCSSGFDSNLAISVPRRPMLTS
jgi:hypothetical protein